MGFKDKIKVNKVTTDFTNYMYTIGGRPKTGKTSLVFKVCRELTGRPDGVLILSVGNETGVEVLPNAVSAEIETWRDFEDAIEYMLEEKHSFEHISIDTSNELVKLAQDELERIHYKETGEYKSISGIYGGYNEGHRRAQRLIDDMLTKLKRSPYGVWIVGHLKVKKSKPLVGEAHDVVTSDLRSDYYSVFEKKSTIVANILVEPVEDQGIVKNERKIYFRTTEKIEAGSRIETLPVSIDYSVSNFISNVKTALEHLNNVDEYSDSDFDIGSANAQNVLSDKKSVQDKVADEKQKESIISDILSTTQELQSEVDDANKAIMEVLDEHSVKNPNKIEDKELAEKVLNDLKELL